MKDRDPYRIGALSFLNTIPLIQGLDADPDVALTRDLPARLADLLYEGRIEVGLIPVVEFLRGVGGELVPGICIASHGEVQTVKVFSKVPLEQATSIAVDRGSRSSVAMLRVLLAERFQRTPDLMVIEPRPDHLFQHHDTVLVIGDRAEQVKVEPGMHVYDLGQMWHEHTGLPFVYAAWVMSPTLAGPAQAERRTAIIQRLQEAKKLGLSRLLDLALQQSEERGVDTNAIHNYWANVIGYDLGEAELAGLSRFARMAVDHNLCPSRDQWSLAEA